MSAAPRFSVPFAALLAMLLVGCRTPYSVAQRDLARRGQQANSLVRSEKPTPKESRPSDTTLAAQPDIDEAPRPDETSFGRLLPRARSAAAVLAAADLAHHRARTPLELTEPKAGAAPETASVHESSFAELRVRPSDSGPTVKLDRPADVHPTMLVAFEQEPQAEPYVPPMPDLGELERDSSSPTEPGDVRSDAQSAATLDHVPIDLPTVFRLAGYENWGVRLAYERISEAQANVDQAELLWVPSLNFGVGYTKHDGQIQATEGQIRDISRNSLFVGGGAVTRNTPLAGGAGGPARFVVDMSLADAIFEPLARRQLMNAARFRHVSTFNDTLQEAGVAYHELAGAQASVVVANDNLADAEHVLMLTEGFVAAGKGSQADVARVKADVEERRRRIVEAELAVQIASAELARILQMDPTRLAAETPLYAADDQLLPVEFIRDTAPVGTLIGQAHRCRPELGERFAQIQARCEQVRQEQWRPFIPNLYAGLSAGGFGGGTGGHLSEFEDRSDFDVAAVWQLQNLGLGNRASVDERESQYRQAILKYYRTRDAISSEVLKASHAVQAQREQIELARTTVNEASDSLDRNIARIRGLAGLPIEAVQAVSAVSDARQAYVDAVIGYNQAQLRLLRAIGRPPGPPDPQ